MAKERIGQLVYTIDADDHGFVQALNRSERLASRSMTTVTSYFSQLERETVKAQRAMFGMASAADLLDARLGGFVFSAVRAVDIIAAIGSSAARSAQSVRQLASAASAIGAASSLSSLPSVTRNANGQFQSLAGTVPAVVQGAGGKFVSNSAAVQVAIQREAEIATAKYAQTLETTARSMSRMTAVSTALGGAVRALGAGFKALLLNPVTLAVGALVAAFYAYDYIMERVNRGEKERQERLKALREETDKLWTSTKKLADQADAISNAGTRRESAALGLSSAELSGNPALIAMAQAQNAKLPIQDKIAEINAESARMRKELKDAEFDVKNQSVISKILGGDEEGIRQAKAQVEAVRSRVDQAIAINDEKVRLLTAQQFNMDQGVVKSAMLNVAESFSEGVKATKDRLQKARDDAKAAFDMRIATGTATTDDILKFAREAGRAEKAQTDLREKIREMLGTGQFGSLTESVHRAFGFEAFKEEDAKPSSGFDTRFRTGAIDTKAFGGFTKATFLPGAKSEEAIILGRIEKVLNKMQNFETVGIV